MYTFGVRKASSKALSEDSLGEPRDGCEEKSGEKTVDESDGEGSEREGMCNGGKHSCVGAMKDGESKFYSWGNWTTYFARRCKIGSHRKRCLYHFPWWPCAREVYSHQSAVPALRDRWERQSASCGSEALWPTVSILYYWRTQKWPRRDATSCRSG